VPRRPKEHPLDLRRQIAIVRRLFPLVIISVILSGATAFIGANMQQKLYESDATLIVGESLTAANPDYNQLLASQRLSKTYATVATTRPLLTRVIDKVGLTGTVTPDELAKKVRASAALDSTLLTITAQDPDPARAAAIANAMAEELIAASPNLQGPQLDITESVQKDLDATQSLISSTQAEVERLASLPNRTAAEDASLNSLQGRLVTLRQTYATLLSFLSNDSSNFLSVVEPAVPAEVPVSPRPLLSLLLGALIGLMIAVAVLFIAEYLDDTVKSSGDVQELLGLPTLGAISRLPKGARGRGPESLVTLRSPRSSAAEAYRTLGSNVEFASLDAPVRSLLVTSAGPGEGKSVCAANLAIVLAQSGHRVLLVDGDLREPDIHHIFNVPNGAGLTELLRTGGANARDAILATDVDGLHILTAGTPPAIPAELLGSRRMKAVLERLQADVDIVVVDSHSLRGVADPVILSSFLDATLLVIEAGRSRRGVVREAGESLARANARVLGVVLNRLPQKSTSDAGRAADNARDRGTGVGAPVVDSGRAGTVSPPR
jgi:non-specific protein-tyrosine kinase